MRAAHLALLLVLAVGVVGTAAWLAFRPADAPPPETVPRQSPAATPLPEERAGLLPVEGRVRDESGAAVAGATVYLLAPDDPLVPADPPFRGRTDREGKFSLRAADDASQDLFVVCPGYRPELLPGVAGGRELDVRLSRGGELRGLVTDDAGRPVAGARITARSVDWDLDPPRGLHLPTHFDRERTFARTLSLLDGSFVLRGLGEDPVDLEFTHRDYPETMAPPAAVEPGATDLELVLLRPFVAEVSAFEEISREPLLGASVEIAGEGLPGGAARGHTDHRGVARLVLPFAERWVPEITVEVTVQSDRIGSRTVSGVPLPALLPACEFAVTLTRQAPAKLSLRIAYDNGDEFAQWAFLEVKPRGAATPRHEWGRAEAKGVVEVVLPPGTYEWVRVHQGFPGFPSEPQLTNVELVGGRTTSRSVTLVRGGDLHVMVRDRDGRKVRRGKACLEQGVVESVHGFWDGETRFQHLPPGPVVLHVKADGFLEESREIAVLKGETIEERVTLTPAPR